MKFRHGLVFAAFVSQLLSCGEDKDDVKRFNERRFEDVKLLSGSDVSNLDANGIRTAVSKMTLLANAKISMAQVKSVASYINRGKSGNFKNCVDSKLDTTPLAVTTDTVSVDFDYDFTAICDSAPQPEELIEHIHNTFKGAVIVGCSGMDFSTYRGKEFKDLNTILAGCTQVQTLKFSYSLTADARKTVKTKKGDDSEVTSVENYQARFLLASADNGQCVLSHTEKKFRKMDSCRAFQETKTYSGAPKFESNSPDVRKDNRTNEPRPVVLQSLVTVKDAVIDIDAPFYRSADAKFQANNWEGSVTYLNGWAAPTWEAKKGEEKVKSTVTAVAAN